MKHYKHDEVITLPSGTEIDIDSARGDLIRARASIMEGAADEHQQVDEAIAADLLRVEELLLVLAGCTGVLDPDHGDKLQHDGDTCPVHEGARSKLADTVSLIGANLSEIGDDPAPEDEREREEWVSNLDSEEYGRYQAYRYVLDLLRPLVPLAQARDPRIVEGARYVDDSHGGETFVVESIPGVESADRVVELTNGQWYELDGPEGLIAKLDAGVVKRVQES